jgi:pimeloyl-ACP methyl ester carboxylesterase
LGSAGTDEANLIDLVKFGRENPFSRVHLENEFSRLSLGENYRRFEVPVFFLLGRHDRHVSAMLAERYFREIEAPTKRLVWFEHSTHNPPFERPGKFNRVLIEDILPIAQGR